jgi:hypothetical protein
MRKKFNQLKQEHGESDAGQMQMDMVWTMLNDLGQDYQG